MKTFAIRLKPGEDPAAALDNFARAQKLESSKG
jgi:predicted DNA-binding protein with PD1-like motif